MVASKSVMTSKSPADFFEKALLFSLHSLPATHVVRRRSRYLTASMTMIVTAPMAAITVCSLDSIVGRQRIVLGCAAASGSAR